MDEGFPFYVPTMGQVMEAIEDDPRVTFMGELEQLGAEVSRRGQCNFRIVWKAHYPSFLSFALPKNSPLTPFLNYQAMRLEESGLLERLREDARGGYSLACTEDNTYSSLGAMELIGVFTLILLGQIVSVSIGIFEVGHNFFRKEEEPNKIT